MSRTLKQIELGSTVVVREGNADVDYILIRKDATSVELLRKRCYSARRMNPTNTTVYDGSEMDQWLTNEETGFLSLFSATLRSNLVNRSISTFTYGDAEYHYISRRCYLPSYGDMYRTTPDALYPEFGCVLPLMTNKGTLDQSSARVARNNADTEAVYWWLRSPSSATYFWYVNSNGSASNFDASYTGHWCRPVLSVSPDTIVSPEGADVIYLLPEEVSRVVEFKGKLSEFARAPRYGCIQVISHNLTNITYKVTNNYGDGNPVWQTVQNNVQFTFTNTQKETENFEIGIHCYGETPNLSLGYFEQPEMLVEG